MQRLRRYFKPTSLTWLASFVPLSAGAIVATDPLHGMQAVTLTINNVTGFMPPAALINMGLIGIGLRGAIGDDGVE